VMVANWDYTQFDPLRTSGEYQNSYNAAASAYNNWRPQAVLGGGPATTSTMGQGGKFEVLPDITTQQFGRGVQATNENPNGWYTDNNDPIVPSLARLMKRRTRTTCAASSSASSSSRAITTR
jgi:hypothetical protein